MYVLIVGLPWTIWILACESAPVKEALSRNSTVIIPLKGLAARNWKMRVYLGLGLFQHINCVILAAISE